MRMLITGPRGYRWGWGRYDISWCFGFLCRNDTRSVWVGDQRRYNKDQPYPGWNRAGQKRKYFTGMKTFLQ